MQLQLDLGQRLARRSLLVHVLRSGQFHNLHGRSRASLMQLASAPPDLLWSHYLASFPQRETLGRLELVDVAGIVIPVHIAGPYALLQQTLWLHWSASAAVVSIPHIVVGLVNLLGTNMVHSRGEDCADMDSLFWSK